MAEHSDTRHKGLSLSFSSLRGLLSDHVCVEGLLLRGKHLSVLLLLVQLLLLDRGLQLVLVLERLTLHLLLTSDRFLISLATLLAHRLLLLELLTVSLKL